MPTSSQSSTTLANGHDDQQIPPQNIARKAAKKGKGMDLSNEASRMLQARISQLEQDATTEKDQELEIEREVKRANRDLAQQVSKMDNNQKIDHLSKRCSELIAETRRLEKENQKNKRRGDGLQKERDNSRTELSKTVVLREKLEKLCRELQRDNNKMKGDNKELQTTQKRTTTAWDEKFATVLAKLEGYQEEKDTPKREVVDMEVEELFRVRFKSFIEQYELRELHFHSLMRTKELEVQYHMGRFEREKKTAEAEAAKNRQLTAQLTRADKADSGVKDQVNMYVDKYKHSSTHPSDQLEGALPNTNELFMSFRRELEDMSKDRRQLEKDNEVLRRQVEFTNSKILEMAKHREHIQKRAAASETKADLLARAIMQMQKQGQEISGELAAIVESQLTGTESDDGDGSAYSGGEIPSDYEEDEDLTDEEEPQLSVPYGPERPPAPAVASRAPTAVNGHRTQY